MFRDRYEPIETPDSVLSTSLLVAFDVVTVSLTAYLVTVYVTTFVWDQLPGVLNWYWIPVILLAPLALWLIVRVGEFPPGSAGERLRRGAAGFLTVAFIFYSWPMLDIPVPIRLRSCVTGTSSSRGSLLEIVC